MRLEKPHSLSYQAQTFTSVPSHTRVRPARSEEHTSELQSPCNLVCRLLLEKKKNNENYLAESHRSEHVPEHGQTMPVVEAQQLLWCAHSLPCLGAHVRITVSSESHAMERLH